MLFIHIFKLAFILIFSISFSFSFSSFLCAFDILIISPLIFIYSFIYYLVIDLCTLIYLIE